MKSATRWLLACLFVGAICRGISAEKPPRLQKASGVTASDGTAPQLRKPPFQLTETDRTYWAFQPVHAPSIPKLRKASPGLQPIDAFLLDKLESAGLHLNPSASPREKVRRLFFDLWGLPPSIEDISTFEKDPSPAAWERLVDRLLSSPRYGERWARHWLDLVRYAESNGYERDGAKPFAWRYRDYVIQSFNQDKPYDQFIREQLSGDEWADQWLERTGDAEASANPSRWQDAIVATGFFRLHVWDDEPDSTLAAEFDDLDDILVTTSTAFLGLTLGCARCHDHKFDPISQTDYYSLLAYFRNLDPYGQHHTGGGGRGTGKITRALATQTQIREWQSEKQRRIREAEAKLAAATSEDEKKRRQSELTQAREAAAPYAEALAAVEDRSTNKPTFLLRRGRVDSPGAVVDPRVPEILAKTFPSPPAFQTTSTSSGRRRVLADWIASPNNPLTARVLANRLWQHHFGAGLVRTPDDFGRTGTKPTHPELLDYLASELIRGGWSIKSLHKTILLSEAYQMSSKANQPEALAKDEGNFLWWRQNLRRVEAEVIRDTLLSASGSLNLKMGGPSVYPSLPSEVHGTQDSSGKGWADSPPEEQNRRSIYLVVKRALKIPLLETFDFANCTSPMGNRPVTTVAPQALMGLNDAFLASQAQALASKLERETGTNPKQWVDAAFRQVLQRTPSSVERRRALDLLREEESLASAAGAKAAKRAALESFCLSLLNLNELIYVD